MKNCRDSDHCIENYVHTQRKQGDKIAHVFIDPTTSKEPIVQVVLHQSKQMNSQGKLN